jgi:predicted nucleic acid-binding protein
VTILDAYAVIAFLRGEPAAEHVRPLLEDRDAELTAVGLAEVLDHLIRLAKADEDDAVLDLAQLGLLDPLPVDADLGSAAGRLRARRYHRTRCAVSMADCIAAVTARASGRRLATADPHLLQVCHVEDIPMIALPASDGTTWTPVPST